MITDLGLNDWSDLKVLYSGVWQRLCWRAIVHNSCKVHACKKDFCKKDCCRLFFVVSLTGGGGGGGGWWDRWEGEGGGRCWRGERVVGGYFQCQGFVKDGACVVVVVGWKYVLGEGGLHTHTTLHHTCLPAFMLTSLDSKCLFLAFKYSRRRRRYKHSLSQYDNYHNCSCK